jgi:hypothetical protein
MQISQQALHLVSINPLLTYVLASPLACFFIFGETILSIIKAATNNDIISWKGRTYQPSTEGLGEPVL